MFTDNSKDTKQFIDTLRSTNTSKVTKQSKNTKTITDNLIDRTQINSCKTCMDESRTIEGFHEIKVNKYLDSDKSTNTESLFENKINFR